MLACWQLGSWHVGQSAAKPGAERRRTLMICLSPYSTAQALSPNTKQVRRTWRRLPACRVDEAQVAAHTPRLPMHRHSTPEISRLSAASRARKIPLQYRRAPGLTWRRCGGAKFPLRPAWRQRSSTAEKPTHITSKLAASSGPTAEGQDAPPPKSRHGAGRRLYALEERSSSRLFAFRFFSERERGGSCCVRLR
jgi:hypothetical protein